MKFDPRELDLLVRLPPEPPPPMTAWKPRGSRAVQVAEVILLTCLAVYFAAGLVGIFLS